MKLLKLFHTLVVRPKLWLLLCVVVDVIMVIMDGHYVDQSLAEMNLVL